ncbi:class D beta-lactamase [Xanthomonadaceae bacterium JHOS43]|nr:class D beta-lactamase [Xanthomonadaceae bacterium JHOS43]
MKRWIVLLLAMMVSPVRAEWQARADWADFFREAGVTGTLLVHAERDDAWLVHNAERAHVAYSPASTFKLFNALVALETGVLADEHDVLRWDGETRWLPIWNRDHSLASGMRYSVVWLNQEVARRVGQTCMDAWLQRVGYGNAESGGGIDQFWLRGGALRITAEQQIAFVRSLAAGTLPFRPEVQEAVRRIALMEDGTDHAIHAKTGWASRDNAPDIGWHVGWVERAGARWFFALNIDMATPDDTPKRLAITRRALETLGALPR